MLKLHDIVEAFPKTEESITEMGKIIKKLPDNNKTYLSAHRAGQGKTESLEQLHEKYALALADFFEELGLESYCIHSDTYSKWYVKLAQKKQIMPFVIIELNYWLPKRQLPERPLHNNRVVIEDGDCFDYKDYKSVIEYVINKRIRGPPLC